ncbi:PmoA family protein [Proteiniphilum sp.]|uniref:DUF6807 domain-containing protein n=1 Tax=Proteiniphilum sp. TaxID=1926877 RepID=UPI002B1EEC54|nr:PmoA family protein [Proteiniphilum sp.]MEA4917891.1 PmoA family protein [Proteiniphilum sp.]
MKAILFFFSLSFSLSIAAINSKNFTVTVNNDCVDIPVSLSLMELGFHADPDSIAVYELIDKKEKAMQVQVEAGYSPKVWFILDGFMRRGTKRTFVAKVKETVSTTPKISKLNLIKENNDLVIQYEDQLVLKYRYTPMSPPKGVDPLFTRSGFIHPLCSPGGEVLTRVQAPDHYHHYGIWGPWTLTHIGNREVDFWNLYKGQGTVKFESFLSEISGSVYTGFTVLQQHIDFGAKGKDQIAINEVLDVRVWDINDKVRIIDYTSILNTPLTEGIMLDAYRYGGGIGFRATEKWTKDNSTVLTSEGKTRKDADGSNARWCIVEGESGVQEGRSGILFLSHPLNRAHPEPMRVWPMDANGGRGDMYFEFTPIRHESWKLIKGNSYVLTYRMIVFDGEIDKETAEMYWNSFSSSPKIEFISKNK